jgi:PAS domain S-box-containing protein
VGIVFINGRGEILNCSPAFALMFGYSKNEIVGENIKIIMPSPYMDYHDQYLERYRNSGKGNTQLINTGKGRILGSAGRTVPAVHADGSIFDITMKVTRGDTGSLSNWETILFKGIVQRSSENSTSPDQEVDGCILAGFTKKSACVLDFTTLDIITMDPEFSSMLGYKPDREFRGISAGVLFRCSDGSFSKDWLRGMFFTILTFVETICSNPLQSFYLYLIQKNRGYLPAAVQIIEDEDEQRFNVYVSSLLDVESLITVNDLGNITVINSHAQLLLGRTEEFLIGQNIKTILPDHVAKIHDGLIKNYLKTGEGNMVGQTRNIILTHRDGSSVLNLEIQVVELMKKNDINGGCPNPDQGSVAKDDDPRSFIAKLRLLEIEGSISREEHSEYFADKTPKVVISSSEANGSGSSDVLSVREYIGSRADRLSWNSTISVTPSPAFRRLSVKSGFGSLRKKTANIGSNLVCDHPF